MNMQQDEEIAAILPKNEEMARDIARGGFADMVLDTDRNEKYAAAIKWAIETVHASGRKANVLEIGTGTGILSMLAAKFGADTIYTCEQFKPIADCAKLVVQKNGFSDKITVINKRSNKLKLGVDIPHKANILIAEVFDTELIGEGALEIYRDATSRLVEENPIFVPSKAKMYAVLLEGSLIDNWFHVKDFQFSPELKVKIPKEGMDCPGIYNVNDMQFAALTPDHDFKVLSKPKEVLNFDFSDPNLFLTKHKIVKFSVTSDGKLNGILVWWDLWMDPQGNIICSTNPNQEGNIWRDHWMQVIHYVTNGTREVRQNTKIEMAACYNINRLQITETNEGQARPSKRCKCDLYSNGPHCYCGAHREYSYRRMGEINDFNRRILYLNALKGVISKNSTCFISGAHCIYGIIMALLGAKSVYGVKDNEFNKNLIAENGVKDKFVFSSDISKVDLLFGEVIDEDVEYPWDTMLKFYCTLNKFESVRNVLPAVATLWAMPVEFEHFWKIRCNVGEVYGFDFGPYDKLLEFSRNMADGMFELHPLWEYKSKSLASPIKIFTVDYKNNIIAHEPTEIVKQKIERVGIVHGIVLWVQWELNETMKIVHGPQMISENGDVVWDKHSMQAVHFTQRSTKSPISSEINYTVNFVKDPPNFKMSISVEDI